MATDEELWAAEAELETSIVSTDEAPFELAIEPQIETEYIALTEIEPEPEAEA
jgi:hypothetical protein